MKSLILLVAIIIAASVSTFAQPGRIIGTILGTCNWRQEPNLPNKVSYVSYNGGGLTCGTTTK